MKKQLLFLVIWGMSILLSVSATAESNPFSVSGYGVIHYSHFNWELDPGRRAAIDIERFVVAPKYRINDTIQLESKLEFKHGGTGTENLKASTSQLRSACASDGENFSSKVSQAGTGSDVYPSQSAAVQEIVNGMIVIADEVANGKISDPYNESDTTLVESQFSFNSIADFQNNIRGIQNVYGKGLNGFVNGQDAALDARFQQEIQAAISAIGAIPDPFRDSITANRGAVQAAIDAVSKVQRTLEQDILTLVQASEFN